MNLAQALIFRGRSKERQLSFNDRANYFSYQGMNYPFGYSTTYSYEGEQAGRDFKGFCEVLHRQNGVVSACMLARQYLFSEARFQFRQVQNGRPGKLFGTQELQRMEQPWPGGTTGDLLSRAIQDVDLAGNCYLRRTIDGIERLRPDWVTIVLGESSRTYLSQPIEGYLYVEGGPGSGNKPIQLNREEVAHFAPIPDPQATYKGMSWLTPIIREIQADTAAMRHKLKYFENGATPNLAVKMNADPSSGLQRMNPEQFQQWVDMFEESHSGVENAYKTLYLAGGADVTPIGSDFKQIDFKLTQGHGETRVCAAARVPPVIVGVSEGLEAATYSNYGQAQRHFADATLRPLWRNIAGSLAQIIQVPGGSELWYDDRDIPFLKEDQTDAASVIESHARTLKSLTEAGYTPESAMKAVAANDRSLLEHTGLTSVQLLPPGKSFSGNGHGRTPKGGKPLPLGTSDSSGLSTNKVGNINTGEG